MELKDSNFYRYYTEKAGLSDADFEALKPYFSFKTVPHNTYLLRAGEHCSHAFFVESGLLQSFSLDEKGGEHILQFAPENWIASDRASHYFNQPSDFYIKAIERYLSFMETYPGLLLRVPQWMIASYLGITPESLSRVRRELLNER